MKRRIQSDGELLDEKSISIENLHALFTRAFIACQIESQGNDSNDILVLEGQSGKIILTLHEEARLIGFFIEFRFSESIAEEKKLGIVNQLNDTIVMARFSVNKENILFIDYFLPYEGGVPPYLIGRSFRMLDNVVQSALSSVNAESFLQ